MNVFAAFDRQDSGCRAYGHTDEEGRRWFVKTAVEPRAVPSLERAVALHRSVRHDTVIPLCGWATDDQGGMSLTYPWADGEVLYGAPTTGRAQRLDKESPHARFRALPVAEVRDALDAILDAHLTIAAAGFVAVDLYDGCFIYDFAARRMWLCDLDEYRPGPFTVDADRLPGSTRFMAPEEFERGRTIDERTTVFNLGRTALVLLHTGDLDGEFRGTAAGRGVLARATQPDPDHRHPSVARFVADWRAALS
ncbi:MAG: serine/threonine protein kinase [Acidimicrobiales bacterium]